MKGHVKLGLSAATLREYMLTDPNGLGMQLTNQMAAKLGQGAGNYDDLQNWSAWVMDNWSAGAGTVDPEGGGFLFGTVDSRVPRQLILPPALGITSRGAQDDLYWLTPHELVSGGVSVTSDAAGVETIWDVKARATTISTFLWVYAYYPAGSTVTVKLYSSGGSLLSTTTTNVTTVDRFHWHRLSVTYTTITAGVQYQVRVSCSSASQIFVTDETGTPFFSFQYSTTNNYSDINKVIRFNDALYGIHPNGLYKYNSSTKRWVAVAGSPVVLTDCIVFNNKLYLGVESTAGNFYTMSTAEAFTGGGTTGEHFHKWNGYLYRVVGDSFYYTADGTTWSGPFAPNKGENILAMCGMGSDVYFANRRHLGRFAPGDVTYGVMEWGKVAKTIGNDQHDVGYELFSTNQGQVGMVNWQGDLYIAVDGQIIRWTAAGQASEIWLKDSGDLPESYIGKIDCLAVMNNYLLASVSSEGQTSVWAWNKQGWHCLTVLPDGAPYNYSMQYDRDLNRLWICGFYMCYFLNISDYAQNPYSLSTSVYMPAAWVETHWFDGSLFEIRKDFESVYLTGDTIGAHDGGNTEVDVYWKDDDSTAWELLGIFTADRAEVRWSSAATRPNSRQIKLALCLRSESCFVTPKIEAVRVKYMSMLLDRYRWTLPIAVAANQEMLDMTLNSYTLAQQTAHVHSLINAVAPIWFEDIDGTQYEVKVLGASRSVRDFAYNNPSTAKVYKLVYSLVIEQVVSNIST